MPQHSVIVHSKQPQEGEILRTFLDLLRMRQNERRTATTVSSQQMEPANKSADKFSDEAQSSKEKEN